MLIKIECDEGLIQECISNCFRLIKKLGYIAGTTMEVNGITIEIYPADMIRGVYSIYKEYLDDLEETRSRREEGEK